MIKLLLHSSVYIEAANNQVSKAKLLLDKCSSDQDLQVWSLGNLVERLVEAGLSLHDIQNLTQSTAQIPVNSFLNQKALESGKDFEAGQLEAALDVFKIDYLVAETELKDSDSVRSCSEALTLISDPKIEKVDFLNINLSLQPIFNKVDGWHTEIIQNTAFAGGNHVAEFEKEFAAFCGAKHAIGVANGTDALRFALIAMGIKPGDEIITVPNTFIATTEIMSQLGAVPVFVDVDERSYNINPELIEAKITPKTKVIVPVHLYGQICDMERILAIAEKHNLMVLEDSCQAHGAVLNGKKAGSFGTAAAFSMYPGKNMGAYGEAGCVVTNDSSIDDVVRCLRDHGQSKKYYHRMEGYNGRMDNLQGAALRARLEFLDENNQKRRNFAKQYADELSELDQVTLPYVEDYNAHVFHLFVILVPEPEKLSAYLKDKNIYTGYHYPVPLHQQEAYKGRVQEEGTYPVTEKCAAGLISLPLFPELTQQQVSRVCEEVKSFFAN